jgi:predicted ATPase
LSWTEIIVNTITDRRYICELRLDQNSIPSRGQYPFSLPAVKKLKELQFHPNVTFFVGENGTGKSTLLEALALKLGLNPEGGSKHFNFATRETHSQLHEHLVLAKGVRTPRDSYFLRAESFYNVASKIDEIGVVGSYGGTSLHEQSHGEAFMALFLNRLNGGLYIFDEPEAALSPLRQLAFLARTKELCDAGSQFVIATHSPILLGYPDSTIYEFSPAGITRVSYEDTNHYAITKRFLNDRARVLKELLESEQPE